MRHLHTAVGDEIRKVAETDPERASEMRMSAEYAAEVRGQYDYDDDDERDGPDYDDPEDEEDAEGN